MERFIKKNILQNLILQEVLVKDIEDKMKLVLHFALLLIMKV